MNKILPALLGTVVGCTAAWAIGSRLGALNDASAYDWDEDEIPTVVPYRGRIERDGVPRTDATSVRFVIENDGGTQLWTETQGVDPDDDGRFEVLLGVINDSLLDVLDDGDDLWLTVWVDGEQLSGRQRFDMTAFALWTRSSGNLTISGSLSAGGSAAIGGDLRSTGNGAETYSTSTVRLGIDDTYEDEATRTSIAFGDDTVGVTGVQLAYTSSSDTLSFEKASESQTDGSDVWSITNQGAMKVLGPVTAGAGLQIDGPATIEGGYDLELTNGSLVLGSYTDGQATRTLSLDGEDLDFNWVYTASSDTLALNAVSNGTSTTVAFQLTVTGNAKSNYALEIPNGHLVLDTTLTSSTLHDPDAIDLNAANKRFYGDSGCEVGTIYPAYRTDDDNSAMICFCLSSTSGGDGQGHGYYCLE